MPYPPALHNEGIWPKSPEFSDSYQQYDFYLCSFCPTQDIRMILKTHQNKVKNYSFYFFFALKIVYTVCVYPDIYILFLRLHKTVFITHRFPRKLHTVTSLNISFMVLVCFVTMYMWALLKTCDAFRVTGCAAFLEVVVVREAMTNLNWSNVLESQS